MIGGVPAAVESVWPTEGAAIRRMIGLTIFQPAWQDFAVVRDGAWNTYPMRRYGVGVSTEQTDALYYSNAPLPQGVTPIPAAVILEAVPIGMAMHWPFTPQARQAHLAEAKQGHEDAKRRAREQRSERRWSLWCDTCRTHTWHRAMPHAAHGWGEGMYGCDECETTRRYGEGPREDFTPIRRDHVTTATPQFPVWTNRRCVLTDADAWAMRPVSCGPRRPRKEKITHFVDPLECRCGSTELWWNGQTWWCDNCSSRVELTEVTEVIGTYVGIRAPVEAWVGRSDAWYEHETALYRRPAVVNWSHGRVRTKVQRHLEGLNHRQRYLGLPDGRRR